MRTDGWDDLINPFTYLGNAAGKVAADAWTAAMLALWNGGLWLLRLVLGFIDTFATPDLRENGPMAEVYRITFWVAATLVIALAAVQSGVAAFRRDGRALARLLIGAGQFVMVWAAWISYALLLLYACSGLTTAIMRATMGVDAWAQWQPWGHLDVEDITDGTIATVLGILGMLVIVAAIGHLLVMLTRAAALVILTATAPIAAAGLVSEVGASWFWKCVRWTHAAAFTPPLMALVIGVGTKVTSATVTGTGTSLSAAVGTAVPGVVLILVSCFAPLALFRLLAFVDPGTSSGAAMRSGFAAAGGVQGLMAGPSGATGTAASSTDSTGRAAGEGASEEATSARFTQSAGGFLGTVGGSLGGAASRALGAAGSLAAAGATVGADLSNQMGVGHSSYVPDFSTSRTKNSQAQGPPEVRGDNPDPGGDISPSPMPSAPHSPAPAAASTGPGAAAGGATASGATGAAAAVPIVPV